MKKPIFLSLAALLIAAGPAFGQFSPGPNPVTGAEVTPRTLVSGTGTINIGGSITTSGTTVAVTMSGISTLNNSGTIRQTGSARAVNNTLAGSLTINNLGFIEAAAQDAIRTNSGSAAVAIVNQGVIRALSDGEGIDGGDNADIQVTNSGTISGRHGITGNHHMTIENQAGGQITGVNGSGVNIDDESIATFTMITNAGNITGTVMAGVTDGDGDGVDVDGLLKVVNSGTIQGLGALAGSHAEGIVAAGGEITNHGLIYGSTLPADAPNGDPLQEGRAISIDGGSGSPAFAATTIVNHGTIWGRTGFGIKLVGFFNDTITNQGTIRGAGTGAAIQMGAGNDQLTNAGAITGDNGQAVDLESGNDTMTISGGSAVVTGDIDGGTGTNTMSFDPGTGNAFSYAGALKNFSQVKALSGTTLLTGASTYSGTTTIQAGAKLFVRGTHSGGAGYTVNGLLGGDGVISLATNGVTITVGNGGALTAGEDGTAGILTILTGNVALGSGSQFILDIVGDADYDQLVLGADAGTLTLAGSLTLNLDYLPAPGTTFTVVNLLGPGAAVGNFAGLPEGTVFPASGMDWQITYAGGTGNDIVLTSIPEPGSGLTVLLSLFGLIILIRRPSRAALLS